MKRDFAVAVKAVIIKENKALVLCRSKREMECSYMNSHQKWDLPGGGLHFFEKAEEGLRREIREEADLRVSDRARRCPEFDAHQAPHPPLYFYIRLHMDGGRGKAQP